MARCDGNGYTKERGCRFVRIIEVLAVRRNASVGIAGSWDFIVGSSVRHSADEECGGL
jgi:hypothetical protein